jgi:hypothetical protein
MGGRSADEVDGGKLTEGLRVSGRPVGNDRLHAISKIDLPFVVYCMARVFARAGGEESGVRPSRDAWPAYTKYFCLQEEPDEHGQGKWEGKLTPNMLIDYNN